MICYHMACYANWYKYHCWKADHASSVETLSSSVPKLKCLVETQLVFLLDIYFFFGVNNSSLFDDLPWHFICITPQPLDILIEHRDLTSKWILINYIYECPVNVVHVIHIWHISIIISVTTPAISALRRTECLALDVIINLRWWKTTVPKGRVMYIAWFCIMNCDLPELSNHANIHRKQ